MSWIDYGLGRLRADALCLVGEEVDDLADLYGELPRRGALFGTPPRSGSTRSGRRPLSQRPIPF